MEISILMSNSNSGSFPQLSIYNGRMLHVFSICATMLGLLFIWAICLYIVQTFVWLWLSPSEESCLSSKSLDETCMPKMGIEFVEWSAAAQYLRVVQKVFERSWKVLPLQRPWLGVCKILLQFCLVSAIFFLRSEIFFWDLRWTNIFAATVQIWKKKLRIARWEASPLGVRTGRRSWERPKMDVKTPTLDVQPPQNEFGLSLICPVPSKGQLDTNLIFREI